MVDIEIGPNLVSAGAFVLTWHGLFSFVAVATAVYLVGRWAPMRGIDPDTIYSIAIWAIIGGVIGARVVHVIDKWDIYQNSPGQIIAIWSGGIGLWGGILGGFAGGALYTIWIRQPLGAIADLTAPALLFVQSIGRLGDIVNGEHCAKVLDFDLGFIWTDPGSAARGCAAGVAESVHPVIAYEILWNMFALLIVWVLLSRLRPSGMVFAAYLALYSVGRFAITYVREDDIWALGMQEAQYIALLVLAITVPLLIVKARFSRGRSVWDEPIPALQGAGTGTRAERRRRDRRR